MKIIWKKMPSVTRENKFFYTTRHNNTLYAVCQSWVTGLWEVSTEDKLFVIAFKTSDKAKRAVEKLIRETSQEKKN